VREYYGVYITPGRASMWLTELRLRENCGQQTSDAEIEAAVRFALSKDFEASDKGFLMTLVMLIRWHRKDRRQAAEGSDGADGACGKCRDGWLDVWLALPADPCADDFYGGRSDHRTVPCSCRRGQHWLDTAKDFQGMPQDQREWLEAMGMKGLAQMRHRARLVEAEINACNASTK
jgi:hypothetical protein